MTFGGLSRRHDRELLDALETRPSEAFSGEAWRVTAKGRDALRGSTAGGRWSPAGEFEVLYTSLARAGALAEIGYRLSLEPMWPSRVEHEVHRITARTKNTLRFADIDSLSSLGVDVRRYGSFDDSVTQAIAAADHDQSISNDDAPVLRVGHFAVTVRHGGAMPSGIAPYGRTGTFTDESD